MTTRLLRLPTKLSCPNCNYEIAFTAISEDGIANLPEEGGIAMCFSCGEFLFFDDDITLRKPTDEEATELEADPEAQMLKATRENMKRRH